MKKIALVFLCASLLAAVSCDKFENLYNSYRTLVTVVDMRTFKTDDGNVFKMVEDMSDGKIGNFKRALITCDIIRQQEDGTYTVKLLSYVGAADIKAVAAGKSSAETLGTDAINLEECTYTGDYLNTVVAFFSVTSSETLHPVNMVYDDVKSNADTCYFYLRHNASGETYANPDIEASKLTINEFICCFDITEFKGDRTGKDVVLAFEWDWHKTDIESPDWNLSREVEHHMECMKVKMY